MTGEPDKDEKYWSARWAAPEDPSGDRTLLQVLAVGGIMLTGGVVLLWSACAALLSSK